MLPNSNQKSIVTTGAKVPDVVTAPASVVDQVPDVVRLEACVPRAPLLSLGATPAMSDPRHGTLAALRQRPLVLFVASRFFAGSAMTLLRATFAWQVYAITGSAFHLGLMGLAQFVPTLTLSLVGG